MCGIDFRKCFAERDKVWLLRQQGIGLASISVKLPVGGTRCLADYYDVNFRYGVVVSGLRLVAETGGSIVIV